MKKFFSKLSTKKTDKEKKESLQNLIGKIASSISTIYATITDSKYDIGMLKNRMSDISSQSVELSSTSEELERNTKDILGLVQSTHTSVEDMHSVAKKGKTDVNQLLVESTELAEYTKQSTEIIHDLNQDSEKIGNAVLIINAVAKQTNLLSLNAAIEAAKAAEHGKGFAVVAEEVRTLANRTTEASKTIRESIETMQTKVMSTLEKFEKIASMSNANLDMSQTIIQAFDELQSASTKVEDYSTRLSSALDEQSISITETARTVEVLNEDIQAQNDIIEENLTNNFDILVRESDLVNNVTSEMLSNRQLVEAAIKDHQIWFHQIDRLLKNEIQLDSNESIKDVKACRFGKWYYEFDAMANLKDPALRLLFNDIESPHKMVHQLFHQIIEEYTAGNDITGLKASLDENSEKIITLMQELAEAF